MPIVYKNLCFWVAWVAVSIGLYVLSQYAIDVPTGYTTEAGIGPDTWPKIVIVFLLVVSSVLMGDAFAALRRAKAEGSLETARRDFDMTKLLATCAGLFVYYAAILVIGIMPASCAAMIVFAKACGMTNWKLIVPLSIALSAGLYSFFYHVAQIPLPAGPLGGML